MIQIYILSYKPLTERRTYLKNEFKKLNIKVKFIIQNKNEYKNKPIMKRYLPNPKIWAHKVKFINKNTPFYKLSDASINLNLNHYRIWEKIIRQKENFAIIFEDDVILEHNFKKNLNKCISQLNNIEWDVCFLDLLNDNRYRLFKKKGLFKNKKNSWGSGGYIINKNALKRILEDTYYFTLPIDEEFKYICKKHNLKVFWLNPPLVHQGSIYGKYPTTNKMAFSNNKNKLKNLISKRLLLYKKIESKRFSKKYWRPIIFIKDIIQEIETQLKFLILKKE